MSRRSTYATGLEHENEPVPGLPAMLPDGERMLWQGAPHFGALALRAFHVRKVALYFIALMLWRGVSALADGTGAIAALGHALWMLPLAATGIALLLLLTWLSARSTLYTITTRRVVMRFGVALPMSVNVPFTIIQSAGLHRYADGTGDLPLQLDGSNRLAYLHLWPHARPWQLRQPQPMLRGLARPDAVARLLAAALAGTPAVAPLEAAAPSPRAATASSPSLAPARA